MPSLSLVCATKNRPLQVIRRVPYWCRSGVDAVMIIDATTNAADAARIESCCAEHGATYLRFKPSWRDTRASQRNLGVRSAKTEWILIQDDDDDIITEFDHAAFDRAASGYDYVWNGKGNCILYHRRENFLRVGGFPEDMVIAEDITFAWLLRSVSRGNLEGSVYRAIEPAREAWEIRAGSVRRVLNMFWYPFTLHRYLVRSPPEQRTNILFGVTVLPFRVVRDAFHPLATFVIVPVYTLALLIGFGWHYTRKTFDSKFRESLRFYRDAFGHS